MKYFIVAGLSLWACGAEPPPKKEDKSLVKKEVKKVEAKKEVKKAEAPKKEEAKVEAKVEAVAARTGEEVYTQVCQVCHQPGGAGLPGAFPPLAGSEWVAKSNETLAKIVLHGLMGEIEVKGAKYNSVMAPLSSQLNDQEIANVLTYVRSNWGNPGGEVKAEEVKAVRDANPGQGMWNPADL